MQAVLGERAIDAYLGGAAAGLALGMASGNSGFDRWEVREAAWRAGYAHPVVDARAWLIRPGIEPPEAVWTFAADAPADADLAVVRARGVQRDVWVGLVGAPRAAIRSVSRYFEPGQTLALPALAGGTYEVADAEGELKTGALPAQLTVEASGEWMIALADADGRAALFPIYVEFPPPDTPLFERSFARPASAEEAVADADAVLAQVRAAYGSDPWERDDLLDGAARQLLANPGADPVAVVSELGHNGATAHHWSCEGASVPSCFDRFVWEPAGRAALLSDRYRHLGIASAIHHDTLAIRIVLSEE